MPSSHESLRNEAAHRALCDAIFSAVAGRVVGEAFALERGRERSGPGLPSM